MSDITKLNFTTTVHGKWILVGEHAVLRGYPAILFPVKGKAMTLRYWLTEEKTNLETSGEFGEELHFLFWSVIERASKILDFNLGDIKGKFHLENNIPLGAGMGASAAICVAVGRWLVFCGKLVQENLLEFARQLENLFHEESSGADIAVAIANEGVYFCRRGRMHAIKPTWTPNWYLSFSGQIASTARCVKKVKALWEQNAKLARAIDTKMSEAISKAEKALQSNRQEGIILLTQAIELARQCFEDWGLTKGGVANHINALIAAGALAAKPTGSGEGGFVVSLWDKPPPLDLAFELISV